jgi:hypothetical protein
MKRLRLLAALPVLAMLGTSLAGCFPALEKDPDFPKYFTKKLPGNTIQARLDGNRLYGASVEVKKDGNTYRGNGAGGLVDLRSSASEDGMRIDGDIASGRTELYVTGATNQLSAKGLVSGAVSHFDVTPDSLTGTIGTCTYDLRKNADTLPYYEGNSRCAGGGGGTRVALPEKFDEMGLDDRAVFLAVFLSR